MSKKILVVEDDDSIRVAVVALLRVEGFEAVAVSNGEEAIAYLRSTLRDPCLVLTDLFMPKVDGVELIKLMRETDELMVIPVVVMSAGQMRQVPPGVPYIKKPFDLDMLIHYVKKFCEE